MAGESRRWSNAGCPSSNRVSPQFDEGLSLLLGAYAIARRGTGSPQPSWRRLTGVTTREFPSDTHGLARQHPDPETGLRPAERFTGDTTMETAYPRAGWRKPQRWISESLRGSRIVALASAAGVALLTLAGVASTTADASGPVPLSLVNGWVGAPFSTATPTVSVISGVVTFAGAISSGSSATAFTLPAAYRPARTVYVPVDTCNATKGRLEIIPSGTVYVEAETSFSNAQCFTSLEGASFAKGTLGYTGLSLQNGWYGSPYSTAAPAAKLISGVVHLEGAMASTGTNSMAFTLPLGLRPSTVVYAPVDMCNATNGRLIIEPTGVVYVQPQTLFSNAACFTSLDGASFALSGTTLSLQNGWVGAPYSTSAPAAKLIGAVVHLKGAMYTAGSNSTAFTVPAGYAPATVVYVPVDMCNATNGRLIIFPSGVVIVQAETSFSNAQCFTSLDGAFYTL